MSKLACEQHLFVTVANPVIANSSGCLCTIAHGACQSTTLVNVNMSCFVHDYFGSSAFASSTACCCLPAALTIYRNFLFSGTYSWDITEPKRSLFSLGVEIPPSELFCLGYFSVLAFHTQPAKYLTCSRYQKFTVIFTIYLRPSILDS